MKQYVKPEIQEMKVQMEGVYAGSGCTTNGKYTYCPFGRRHFNSGSDMCQDCAGDGYVVIGGCPMGFPTKG